MAKVDTWILDAVLYAVEQFRGEVAQLISYTVGQWDAEETSKKIELQIGKDLQYVRINGTLVGGLVGLLLYSDLEVLLVDGDRRQSWDRSRQPSADRLTSALSS